MKLDTTHFTTFKGVMAKVAGETFSAKGLVLGLTWEDVEGIYPLRQVSVCYNRDSLQAVLDTFLQVDTLTETGNFKTELGAILAITTITTLEVQGYLFTNEDVSIEYIGDLTAEQMERLDDEMSW